MSGKDGSINDFRNVVTVLIAGCNQECEGADSDLT